MDPNSGKKEMFNKLRKDLALQKLDEENFKRKTVSFYRYVILDHPYETRDKLYKSWNDLGVLGRIYLAHEGINAQLSIPDYNWKKFIYTVHSNKHFHNMLFKVAVEDNGRSFYKLTIKVRNQIVSDGLPIDEYDVTNVGEHLDAREWNKAMENGAIVVDMRNHYESEIGKFKGAICPDVETFKEELPIVKNLLKGKEDKQILLYCTGGIRCEKTSAYLKHHGFNNLSQLHGGIIDYSRQLSQDSSLTNNFEGKNFVFDERRGERISNVTISNCHQCGNTCDNHVNCKNVNCNLLFLQCEICIKEYQNCCSLDCLNIIKLTTEERNNLRKKTKTKKMYYSHKKINLNLRK